MSTRTVQDGTTAGQTGRYTVGQPDGLNVPLTGTNPGRPPFVWMTGGGTLANGNPAKVGMDRILDYLCDDRGYSLPQPNVPWYLGGNGVGNTANAIDDAVAWARANLGATDDPPILMGMSNGWVCSIIYARQFPVTGVIGLLPVTGGRDGYINPRNDPVINGFGLRGRIEDAWGVTYPEMPPDIFSPYDDVANYPTSLFGKVIGFYSCCDPLYVSEQMTFLSRIRAVQRNIGATGHLGTFDPSLNATEPIDNVDVVELADFVDSLWT